MPQSNVEATGYKRGYLLRQDNGEIGMAGTFSGVVVGLDATAPAGVAGFSAYETKSYAHRYRPAQLPLLTVALSGGVDRDVHLLGRRQRLTAVAFNALCGKEGCTMLTARHYWGQTTRFPGATAQWYSACDGHTPPTALSAEVSELVANGLDVRTLGVTLSRYVRSYEHDRPTRRCPCRVVSYVDRDSGLRLYATDLWSWGERRATGDGSIYLPCWECGTWWRYQREQGVATQVRDVLAS